MAATRILSLPWLVAVFAQQDVLDARFPVIGARDATEAVQLALRRAQQIMNGILPDLVRPGLWRVGDITVACEAAFGQSVERGVQ